MKRPSNLDRVIGALESEPVGHFVEWVAPKQRADGVIVLPYPRYSDAMGALWRAFADAGCDPAARLDYSRWENELGYRPESPVRIAAMDRKDLSMLVVKCQRGERFCTGYWQTMLTQGVFLAIARRLRELG